MKIKGMNKIYLWFFLFIYFFGFNFIFINALEVKVNINETSSLTKLLSGQYSLQAKGEIKIYNPSNISQIYEFNIPLSIDSLVGITKVNVLGDSNKFNFDFHHIHGYFIAPNQTIKTHYRIFGIIGYNIYNSINNSNLSILGYYSDPIELSSKINLFLEKPQREGFKYNLSGSMVQNASNSSRRLISAGIKNPTDFSLFSRNLKIYKSSVSDPFFRNGQILKTFSNESLLPFSSLKKDVFDSNSNGTSVYWISSDFIIKYLLNTRVYRSFIIQVNSVGGGSTSSGVGGSSSSSGGGGSIGSSFGGGFFPQINNKSSNNSFSRFYNSVLLKKYTNITIVRKGDVFKVFLSIVNVNNFSINNFSVFDIIPKGYELKDTSLPVKLNQKKLTFKIDFVGPYQTKVLSYILINKNDLKGITYLKPAQLKIKNENIFSEGVLLINGLLPDKKIFVQKNIEFVDKNFARVTIKVKNLGSIKVNGILISDVIDKNSLIKDISKVFYKPGSWKIKTLSPGEEWSVSYLIERNTKLNLLPNVYGIDKSKVYGNIISSNEIVTVFKQSPKPIEKVGMVFAVGLLVVYLLF